MRYTVQKSRYASASSPLLSFQGGEGLGERCVKNAPSPGAQRCMGEHNGGGVTVAFSLIGELPKFPPPRKKTGQNISFCPAKIYFFTYTARWILPERKQRVQILIFLGAPLTIAFTFFTFAFHVLFVLLWEWDTAIPNDTLFPQISHFAMIHTSLIGSYKRPLYKEKPQGQRALGHL